jgi:hypothetical protein
MFLVGRFEVARTPGAEIRAVCLSVRSGAEPFEAPFTAFRAGRVNKPRPYEVPRDFACCSCLVSGCGGGVGGRQDRFFAIVALRKACFADLVDQGAIADG